MDKEPIYSDMRSEPTEAIAMIPSFSLADHIDPIAANRVSLQQAWMIRRLPNYDEASRYYLLIGY